MAQSGYTPISLYFSATGAAVPTAGNLVAGELALNTNDGKLYYKNSSGVVTLLASATTVTNSFSAGTTGLTPNTATTGAVTLAGTLAVANGGTGLTAGTSGGVLAYTATGTLASSAALAASALVIGGGAGAAPSTTTTGTGVVTALGVNVGSAGAFVVNGGALGTPSGGTVTNLTGTASININGTVGATTATTGAFTTVSATSNIYTSARYFAQRLSSSLSLAIGGYSDGSAATVLTGAIGDIVAFGNVGGDGVIFANSNTERMRLTDTGLGIGTSSPNYKLQINNPASGDSNYLQITHADAGTGASDGMLIGLGVGSSPNANFILYENAPMLFFTNGTERVRIDSSGNLGIGTNSPAYKLDVSAGSGTGIRLKSTGAYGTILADNTGTTGGGNFSACQNGVQITLFGVEGAVLGNTSTNTAIFNDVVGGGIKLYTNASATPKATLDSSGNLLVGVATANANGGVLQLKSGITFPATAVAATDANTLDDYEEGTWTPTIQGGTTAGTYTYEAARTGGKYTKVGNVVTVWASFRIDIITTAGTGALNIGGLPFSSGSRMAPSWNNSDSLMVNLHASGVNVSAATYPPPLMGALGDGVTSFDVVSYGKNYAVATVIGDLSGANWIYTISGSYTTT